MVMENQTQVQDHLDPKYQGIIHQKTVYHDQPHIHVEIEEIITWYIQKEI